MRFLETPIFTDVIENLLDLEEYHALQMTLVLDPTQALSSATAVA